MAVVQISRIQVRRGKKGVDNLPQLASGELGWAIDTQEFYVGNGSVSEGAPAVGNTKVLTENWKSVFRMTLTRIKPPLNFRTQRRTKKYNILNENRNCISRMT